ncbi:MAG: DNA polymerase IV [Candidatus Omnitrophica bacterium]|nr:DNA polymerase IV [Candidatus Omnitrophota bacterium]
MQTSIIHIDMDAFFASVEQRDNPLLVGKPVIIGADPKKGRGVVSTCSYEARRFGVSSAMPVTKACRLCPDAVFLPPNIEKYYKEFGKICEIFYEFTPRFEPVSIDEAFLDISASCHLFGGGEQTAHKLKQRIKKQRNLTASIGLAPSKFVAKIASDIDKPDGYVYVKKEDVLSFLHPLDVSKMWGVGKKTAQIFDSIGIKTIGQLAKSDVKYLVSLFGKNGINFWQLANGVDKRAVQIQDGAKSISNEITFLKDSASVDDQERILMQLSEKVSGRLRADSLKAKTLTLKIRFSDFSTLTRALTTGKATNFSDVIFKQIVKLYRNLKHTKGVRLLGVKASNFSENMQLDMFSSLGPKGSIGFGGDEKRERVHMAMEKIKKSFGDKAIYRAKSYAK